MSRYYKLVFICIDFFLWFIKCLLSGKVSDNKFLFFFFLVVFNIEFQLLNFLVCEKSFFVVFNLLNVSLYVFMKLYCLIVLLIKMNDDNVIMIVGF